MCKLTRTLCVYNVKQCIFNVVIVFYDNKKYKIVSNKFLNFDENLLYFKKVLKNVRKLEEIIFKN